MGLGEGELPDIGGRHFIRLEPPRIALAARAPLVPVVIENSRDVLPPRGWWMRPATVRVVVHPARSTESWTLEDLELRIREVEALYAGTEGT